MKSKNLLVLVATAIIAAVFMTSLTSAFATIERVTVNGIEGFGTNGSQRAAVFAGETIPVRVIFNAHDSQFDVRVVARLIGEGSLSEVSERFDVLPNNVYSRLLNIKMPFDINPSDLYAIEVSVESNARIADSKRVDLEVQRESYLVEILSVNSAEEVKAGQTLALDVVLKNRGRQLAEDTYVRASILELGASNTVYFGDLGSIDQAEPDEKEDAVGGRIYLSIPKTAKEGIYEIELEAYNSDSSTIQIKRVVVVGSGQESRVVSPSVTKTFAAGETNSYSITIVNSGDSIKVYDLVLEAPKELTVGLEEPIAVVPAGSSRTVSVNVAGSEKGTYNFAVNIYSDGELVKRENFGATIEGAKTELNASVVLTVVLAVIFAVLVIVLIVLLTRKPNRTEEFGESYY